MLTHFLQDDCEDCDTLSEEDFERGRYLDESLLVPPPNTTIFTGKYPGLFEGDILVVNKEASIAKPYLFWPNGRIPYVISGFTQTDRSVIARAMDEYHQKTCIRFVPRQSSDTSYVYIYRGKPGDCHSTIGRNPNGRNDLSLGDRCVNVRTVIHELMHNVGFKHEMSRFDRDQYITVIGSNVPPSLRHNFDVANKNLYKDLLSYDYLSVMHYDQNAFGNGKITIRTKDPEYQAKIGTGPGFSLTDIKKIKLLYKCK